MDIALLGVGEEGWLFIPWRPLDRQFDAGTPAATRPVGKAEHNAMPRFCVRAFHDADQVLR
jgi:hypothetical protein